MDFPFRSFTCNGVFFLSCATLGSIQHWDLSSYLVFENDSCQTSAYICATVAAEHNSSLCSNKSK